MCVRLAERAGFGTRAMSQIPNAPFFFGTHTSRIDSKGRVSFPASFRAALGDLKSQGVFIYRSPKHTAIDGVTVERLQQMSAALEKLSPMAEERDDFETAIFGTAQLLQFDSEGRCAIPRALLDEVGIGSELAFLGRSRSFQIWEPGALAARKAKSAEAVKTGAVPFPTLSADAA
jgi:MraZ protein